MRDLEFRLRDENNKIVGYEKWYHGAQRKDLSWAASPCYLYSFDGIGWAPKPIFHRYKDQFTGLLDKNGKKVFEGDLIRNEVGNIFQIYYDQYLCMFRQRFLKNRELSFEINPVVCSEYEEVIGNIYENPDLLEQNNE